MKTKIFILGFIFLMLISGCCTQKELYRQNTITINDSLHIIRKTADTLVKIPESWVFIDVDPSKMKDGDVKEKQSGQANIRIEYKNDSIFITAKCDSLEMNIKFLEEEIFKVRSENEELKEQIIKKPAVSGWTWFWRGFIAGILFIAFIFVLIKLKNK